ncbi:gamma-glutamylcyclotransferase [Haloferula sp. BvORR071]|uniref:gamma-glutamylcyclotransferase family protein n=1 Tax=Haloferula sp. BvORR071 TaxID=1396141 RepID=UPI00054DF152|nr:gamma-glutamylcyclotransferase [Haloferula sp. BvORR071]
MSEDKPVLVFVVGSFRQGMSEAYVLDGAEYVCVGLAKGGLYEVSGLACFVPGEGHGYVTGDLYRMPSALLQSMLGYETEAGGLITVTDFRLSQVDVHPLNLGQAPWQASVWEWTGSPAAARLVPNGDWLDWASPRQAPLCTIIAVLCLLSSPLGFLALGSFSARMSDLWMDMTHEPIMATIVFLIILEAPVGLYAAWLGQRRRERWQGLRRLLFPLLGLCSIPAVVALCAFLLGALSSFG